MKVSDFQNICKKVELFKYTDFRQYLAAIYTELKEEPGDFSYQKLSELLGLGSGNVSYLFIHGKRNPSERNIKQVAQKIGLTKSHRRYFVAMAQFQVSKTQDERDKWFQKMLSIKTQALKDSWDVDTLTFFSEWYYSAIFEILGIKGSKDNPEWLAQVLFPRVSHAKIKAALDHMRQMNLLERDQTDNKLVPSSRTLTTGPLAKGTVFKSYHREMIRLGSEALINSKAKERDISSVTVAIAEDKLIEMKKLASEFRKKILDLGQNLEENTSSDKRVYQVNIQIFPLTELIKSLDPIEKEEDEE